MNVQRAFTLIDSHSGHLSFKFFSFEDNSHFDHIQRLGYYSLIWVKKGKGKLKADFSEYEFTENTLFPFSPYQPFMFQPADDIEGMALQFHPDFFCIHKHQQELACNGILFNNIYQPPLVTIDEVASASFELIFASIKDEIQRAAPGQHELLVSYLKIFLITATRLKANQHPEIELTTTINKEPLILQNLKTYIETHFKTLHSAGDYAELLNISPKALAKITRSHFNKTLTDIIAERIIIEAKRELYLTSKPVKQIAYELGYEDEYYFSRFFKNNTEVSPQRYRERVGFAKAEPA